MNRDGLYTRRQRLKLEQKYGYDLDFVDVTVFGDTERMYLLASPRCEYCGVPVVTLQCVGCGAGPRDGPG